MSAFGGKADIGWRCRDVRYRPKADTPRIVVFGLSRVTCFLYRIFEGLGWVS